MQITSGIAKWTRNFFFPLRANNSPVNSRWESLFQFISLYQPGDSIRSQIRAQSHNNPSNTTNKSEALEFLNDRLCIRVPRIPSLEHINLLEWLTEASRAFVYTCQNVLREKGKQHMKVHKIKSGSFSSRQPVPGEWKCRLWQILNETIFSSLGASVCSSAQKFLNSSPLRLSHRKRRKKKERLNTKDVTQCSKLKWTCLTSMACSVQHTFLQDRQHLFRNKGLMNSYKTIWEFLCGCAGAESKEKLVPGLSLF